MQQASEAVAYTLKEMRRHVQPGMTTKQLDNYGAAGMPSTLALLEC